MASKTNEHTKYRVEESRMTKRKGVAKAFIVLCILGVIVWTVTMSEASVFVEDNAVRVISMSASEVIVELTLPQFTIETVQGPDGATYSRIHSPGWAITARAGYPELPFKRVLLELSNQGTPKVEILQDHCETRQGYLIYPVPQQSLSDEGKPVTTFFKDADAYANSGLYPQTAATLGRPAVLRGTRVAPLDIQPFQWNPATGELKCHARMRLKVLLGGAESVFPANAERFSSPEKGFQTLKERILVNNSVGKLTVSAPASKTANTPQAVLAEALRLEVAQDGIYRLTYEEMAAAGVPSGIDPRTFQLFNKGNEAAIHVTAGGESFGPVDSILFYGEAVDNRYTGANVYFLYWSRETGRRMGEIDGTVTGAGTPVTAFDDVLYIEENHTLWEGMPGAPELEYWFWERLTAPRRADYAIHVPSRDGGAAEATLKVIFQGRSTASPHPNHHTVVYLNGTEIGNDLWDGAVPYVQEMTIPHALLTDGANTLGIDTPGDTGASVDIVYFNRMELAYKRLLQAGDDTLRFTVREDGRMKMTVSGLGSPDVQVLDITDPARPNRVTCITVESDGESYRVLFEDDVLGAKSYCVTTADRTGTPAQMALWQSTGLERPENGADWILVTGQDMVAAALPLAQFREAQGLRVKVVGMADVYDEFGFGLVDPGALKAFLQYAYENWVPPAPTYVFLMGDADTDYRDYLESGKRNVVPPHLCHTSLGVTPEDNWYVCMDGPDDVLPDMFIGRVPASGPDMAETAVAKIAGFENSQWPTSERVLLAADNNETSFEDLNESLVPYLPSRFEVDRVYLRQYSSVGPATADIIAHLDQGVIITNYVGHGNVTDWAGEHLFDSGDVPLLSNPDRLSFVIAMTCLNGYFSQPFRYCLAEEFVAAENKGAIAAFAPSGLGYVWEHNLLDTALFSNLFEEKESVIGPAAIGAKIRAYGQGMTQDAMRTFILFGDPATRLKIPQNDVPLPDIRANGLEGPVWSAPTEPVNISVSLFPGNPAGRVCDWWLSAGTPMGTYWCSPYPNWNRSSWPLSTGSMGLFAVPSTPILDRPLPVGVYTFAFGLDADPDGTLNSLDWYNYVNVISSDGPSPVTDVIPDVKANGQDQEWITTPDETVDITLSLDPGSQDGVVCDWWIGVSTPYGVFWYDVSGGWQSFPVAHPTVIGGLFQVGPTGLLSRAVSSGIYTFFFILDQVPNGILDDISWYDLVNVISR
jgi:hypothetical protein